MLSSIATAIISPVKQSIIGAIYSFSYLHGTNVMLVQTFLVRSICAKISFQKIFRPLRFSVGFGNPVGAFADSKKLFKVF